MTSEQRSQIRITNAVRVDKGARQAFGRGGARSAQRRGGGVMSPLDEWRERYNRRIRSTQWKNLKRDLIRLRGNQCERCAGVTALELHHKTYERLGFEQPSDLELLCYDCHRAADEERAAASRARAALKRYASGLDTYATKKYGEYWDGRDLEAISEEFDRWLERQGE